MIAIHTRSGSFVAEWVAYCQEKNIPFKEVDCFSSDVVDELRDCSALLWHWAHNDFHAQLFARQLIVSIEKMGLHVYPSTETCWHYDDKVGQKYLLEAIGAPLVPSHVFYNRERALQWVEQTDLPKVWKLRGGAGSQNVQLVRSRQAARRIVKRSFGGGWKNSRFHALQNRIWHFRRDKTFLSLMNIARGVARAVYPHEANSRSALQRDYVYFQDFVPDNNADIRVIVIGDKAFAIKRMVREGDFRASGSGAIVYDREAIPLDCIRIAFEVASQLRSQSCAFDFVKCADEWHIVEISYTFSLSVYKPCPGYWDSSLHWHSAFVTPERYIIEDVLTQIGNRKA